MELHTKSQLVALLRERGIRPSRGLGQNFLIDQNLLRTIAAEAALTPSDVVLEIGPGTGLLTRHLCESGAAVCAAEVDARLAEICREYLAPFDNLTLFVKDVLKSKHALDPEILEWLSSRLAEPGRGSFKVVSNLPYAVSTPVIAGLLQSALPVGLMVLTVQKEVAERLVAHSGDEAYGALSVVAQVHARVKLLRTLPPDVFWPPPKVHSAIVRLTPTDDGPGRISSYDIFRDVLRAVFGHRRKTLINSMAAHFRGRSEGAALRQLLEECGIDPSCRGETLSIDRIIAIANRLSQRRASGSS